MVNNGSPQPQTQRTELLTKEEQYDLILQVKEGDERASRQLVRKNIGLVKKTVSHYGPQADWRVLTSAGEMAVIEAARRFNLSSGHRFSTYAVRVIWSEVRDCFCRETGISRNTLENLRKISKASAALSQELGREPALEEIVERSELTQQQILTTWQNKAFAQPLSFNKRFNDNCPEWLDSQIDETANPWGKSEDAEILDTLDQLESNGYLESRQVTILIAKYQGYNNSEIGKQLEISRERVRQLLKGAGKTLVAFKEGALKLIPKRTKTKIPVSTHHDIEPIGEGNQPSLELPAPEETKKPVVKRVDASRLGGRIGRAIKQIFYPTHEGFDDQYGELAHAQEPILVHGWGSDHGPVDVTRHRLTPKSQRCHRLEGIQDSWQGYLGFSQEITDLILLPLAFVYQFIRGFQKNNRPTNWRPMMHLTLIDVVEALGIGYRKEHPRPPNHCLDSDENW